MNHIKSYSMLLLKNLKIKCIKISLYKLFILIAVFVISSCSKVRKESFLNLVQEIKEGNEDNISANVLISESDEWSDLDNAFLLAVKENRVNDVEFF